MHHQAVAKELTLNLHPPLTAQDFRRGINDLLLELAMSLSLKGIVPGHIKVLVVENDVFAAFSCTKPGKITESTSLSWEDSLFVHPHVYLNVVVVGVPEESVNAAVKDFLRDLYQEKPT